jgi:hypothetical protein
MYETHKLCTAAGAQSSRSKCVASDAVEDASRRPGAESLLAKLLSDPAGSGMNGLGTNGQRDVEASPDRQKFI